MQNATFAHNSVPSFTTKLKPKSFSKRKINKILQNILTIPFHFSISSKNQSNLKLSPIDSSNPAQTKSPSELGTLFKPAKILFHHSPFSFPLRKQTENYKEYSNESERIVRESAVSRRKAYSNKSRSKNPRLAYGLHEIRLASTTRWHARKSPSPKNPAIIPSKAQARGSRQETNVLRVR